MPPTLDRRAFVRNATGLAAATGLRLNAAPITSIRPGCPTQFVLDNVLDHPLYFWPTTLLNYRIDCATDLSKHHLKCLETGETRTLQLGANGTMLRFLADLPASTTRTWQLEPGPNPNPGPVATSTAEGNTITLDSGPMQIRIPATQTIAGTAPGPIVQMKRAGRWVGKSTFTLPGTRVLSITTEPVEQGPLLQTYRVTYAFEGGGQYIATIDCMAGIDFFRLHEEMHHLPAAGGGRFDFTFTGIPFTHRQFPNHPYPFPTKVGPTHLYDDYPWEPIGQKTTNTHIGLGGGTNASGEMTMALGVFQPWPAFNVGNFATFWTNPTQDAASIFIDRTDEWRDPDYPIWSPSPRLNVRFTHANEELTWTWPLEQGGRSTCISFYDHAKDKAAQAYMEKTEIVRPDGEPYGSPGSYGLFLQNRFGTVNLDRVKDWQLTYDGPHPPILFHQLNSKDAGDLERRINRTDIVVQLVLTGTRQNGGFGPVPHRQVLDWWVADFNQLYPTMTPSQRRRLTAHYLMQAYVCAGEDYMPMIPMLSGHPNFLSDVKSAAVGIGFLFPQHPQAKIWSEEWDRYLALNTRYHTRPAVPSWGSRGGRWTENLGTYVWGFVRPALRADFLARQQDSQEHFTTPQIVQLGDWLVNALSAPFNGENPEFYSTLHLSDAHLWGVVAPNAGPRRLHPAMGAHAERRKTPRAMWYMGHALQQYAPLTAEHLMWASRPTDQDQEQILSRPDTWKVMYDQPDNLGTNPHLRTSKYTGFGITLRAAVDTPEELSVHLVQIDDGPNYRWGVPGEGGCGLVYFFANGKGYSHNGKEDEGDRNVQDTDLGSTFGVWKGGKYNSIGQNVLAKPLYDLDLAQLAELEPRTGPNAYCSPEYVGRRVLLAGSDYFVLYDQVFGIGVGHRFSWFVQQGDDFPSITLLRGWDKRDADSYTALETKTTKGKWFDGRGDSMALITHKNDITSTPTPYGAKVKTAATEDWVFLEPTGTKFHEDGLTFEGTSGLIRKRGTTYEVAIFHGTSIGANGLTFTTTGPDLGLSAAIASPSAFTGRFTAHTPTTLQITGIDPKATLYIDGTPTTVPITLPAGTHDWQLTTTQPIPQAPEVLRTEYHPHGAKIHGTPVAASTTYRAELSEDNGHTWKPAASAPQPTFDLALTVGHKYHVRLAALNSEHESKPGPEYPIYATQSAPPPPSGLMGVLKQGSVSLAWGEVLGTAEYRLYRRQTTGPWTRIYQGLDRIYTDHQAAIHPANPGPGLVPTKATGVLYEYAVTSANANGESQKSRITDTNPGSWRNWDPREGEPFRRGHVAGKFGTPPNDGGGYYYPA